MNVIVSQGNSPYKVSAGGTDSGDVVVSGGSMFVLSAGVASATTVSSGGFLTINKGGSGSGSHLSGGNETISGTETGSFIESGGSQRVLAPGKAISTTVDSSGTLTVLSGGTASAAIVNNGGNMLVAKGGVVAGVTINIGAVVSNAGIVKANALSSAAVGGVVTNANTIEALGSGAVVRIFGSITDTGTILASGSGAHVELNGAVISGGKLQTLAGGEIDANNGVLSGVTIASGSIVDINNNGTLALSGRIANSGLISALGSPSFATLAISGAVVLSGGGKVSLSPSGNNQIVAALGGGILSNVNNTIAGAGFIGGGGLALVNSGTINANTVSSTLGLNASTINAGKLEATASGGTLLLAANISNTSTGTILASGSGAHVVLNPGTVISGGKLQTLAGGEIDVINGLLSDTTIASGSIVDINNNGTLALSGRIANSGLISALGSPSFATLAISGAVVLSGGGKVSLSPSGNNQIVAALGGGILSNVNNTIAGAGFIGGGGLALVNSGTINANTVSSTLGLNASTINAGKLEATASGGTLLLAANISNTSTGTILASGSGAHVVLNPGTVISGGTLQTLAGGEIDVINGLLSDTTIASGSIVDINNNGTLALSGRVVNLGLISALGSSPNFATLMISGAVVLSGGGKVSLSPSGNNRIVAVPSGATLSNVNNTIAGAGAIGFSNLTLVNSGTINANTVSALQIIGTANTINAGKLEATTSGTLILAANISNTSTGTILASGSGAHVVLSGAVISGGTLQTLARGEIGANFGVLSGATIASGSIVDINNNGTLALSGRVVNLGLISALGSSPNFATLMISGAVVLSGGGKVSLSPSGNNRIVAVPSGATLSNVNNTIAGAGAIGFSNLTLVNSGTINANTVSALQIIGTANTINAGKLEATTSGTLILAANISNTSTGTILASGSGAHVVLSGAVISGGKLQTLAGGEIDANNGVLSGATIASGSIVDIPNLGTLTLVDRIANLGLISALGSPNFATLAISGAVVLSGGGKVSLSPSGNNQIVAATPGAILSNVNNTIAGAGFIGGGLTVVNSGTINANTFSTLQLNASTINAGKLEATASGGTLILAANISNTSTGTILASGSGAHVALNGGAVILGGKLQTLAGGEIDANNGVLSGATIASGSIVDINNLGTLTLVDRIANLGLISALGSPNFATLAISGAVVLSGGGKVSLSPSGNNLIVAATPGAILSNVNNTIAGAGFIGGGLTVVNSGTINANTFSTLQLNASTINAGKLEATASGGTLILAANISNTGTGTILASGSGARVDFNNATILGGKLQTSGAGAVIETQNGTTDLLSGCTIAAASLLEVTSNATLKLSGGTIGVGAVVETLTGGTVSVTGTVHNSGSLFASGSNSVVLITSGAVVTGGIALIGDGIVDIAGSSGESVNFLSNGSGGLKIADTQSHTSAFSGSVSGFGGSGHSNKAQFIDLVSVTSAANTISLSYVSAASHTSGTLFVSSGGTMVAAIKMVGSYSVGNFHITSGAGGTVAITDPTVPNGGSVEPGAANVTFGAQTTLAYSEKSNAMGLWATEGRYAAALALLGNYMAASFATAAGGHGGAVVTQVAETASTPLLAHPHMR